MKLGMWRALVVAAVAVSACVGIYEVLAPRIDLADGAVQPVGPWFSIPGRPTATFLVISELRGSNLAAAGIAVGDRYTPHDSFVARWLWYPGERIPVTVIHHGAAAEATIVASDRPLVENLFGWIVRVGRLLLQAVMLTLAIVVAWHFADAPWVRWLCVFLVLSGFSPWQVDPLEYIGWWRVTAFEGEATATQAAICAAMIFAATIRGRPPSDFRLQMVRFAAPTFVFLEIWIVANLFDARAVYVTPPLRLVQLVCIVAIVSALTAAAAQATGQERQRLRYIAWTFGLGFSGFFFSVAALWVVGNNWGTNFQVWSIPRLTLLLIPIGLAYGLLSHRVVSSHYIASRTLVYGAITSALVPIFTATEWTATNFLKSWNNAFVIAIVVIVTASFKKIQKRLEDLINRVIFNKQHETEKALDKFAKEVKHIDDAATLEQRYVGVVSEHVGATSTALYIQAQAEELGDGSTRAGFVRVAEAGDSSPSQIERLDSVVVALKSESDAIECELLGAGGHAFPMIARDRLVGLLAIGPIRDGEILSPDETSRLTKLTQAVAVALESLRLTDLENRLAEAETRRAELQRILTEAVRPSG
jgi:hypothetical protein